MSGRRAEVPTMDDFNKLQEQVNDQQTEIDQLNDRVTNLEQGGTGGGGGGNKTPSPDGTEVRDTSGSIIDDRLRTFTLVGPDGNYMIDMDGSISGGGVIRLYAKDGRCYQENSENHWWYMGDTDWVVAQNPTGEAPPEQPPSTGGNTVFGDEFDGPLDTWNPYAPEDGHKWQRARWYGNDWNGWVCNEGWMINPDNPATRKPEMYRIENSCLLLDVQRTPDDIKPACGGKNFLTAQINSFFSKKGGYWEARVKAPFIPGTNMAFWLMNHKTWPPEVDICELVNGGDWTLMSQGIWYAQADQGNEHYSFYGNQGFNIEEWHTYGFWWDAANKRMQMFYDGTKTMDQAEPDGYDEPMFVICGSQSGGDWSGPIPADATMNPLMFDYVRCYENPPSEAATMQLTTVGERSRGRLSGRHALPGGARGVAPGRERRK